MGTDRSNVYDHGVITLDQCSNPEDLQDLLRCMTREVDSLRQPVNELITDHAGFCSSFDSMHTSISGMGSMFMSAMTRLTTSNTLAAVSTTVGYAVSLTAGPAVLTASSTTQERVLAPFLTDVSGGTPQ